MKTSFLLGLLLLVPASAAKAQIIDITFTGTISQTSGYDASVIAGSPVTINFEFNLADAVPASSNSASVSQYTFASLGSATSTDTFGDNVLTQTDNSVVKIISNAQGEYGYLLESSDAANEGGDFVELISTTTPAVAPTSALSSIGTFPVSDFNAGALMEIENDAAAQDAATGEADLLATLTSYTVTSVVPEPSSYALLGAGLLAIAALKFSRKKVRA